MKGRSPTSKPGFQIEGKSVRYIPLTGCRRNGKLYQLVDVEIPEFQNHPLGLLVQDQQAMKIVTLDGMNGVLYQLDVLANHSVNGRCNPEIEPRAENRIVLTDQGRDFFGNPIPSVILDYSRPDKRTIQRCKAFLTDKHRELSTSPLQRHFKWRGHPSGTVRMGHSEIDGVVDRNNKMFGVANLYVSGACTFPTSGTANPTNTVVALTLRLAAHILAKG